MNPMVYPAITVLTSIAGIAMMWGVLKTNVEHLKSEVDRLCETVNKNESMFLDLREEVHVRLATAEARKNGRSKGRAR